MLVDDQLVPYTQGDSVAFLYRGNADDVRWAGDFTGWRPDPTPGRRVGATNVWIRTMSFPPQARLDYKIVVDGEWMLDPANPRRQMSGFGPNSELHMPGYVHPEETVRRDDVARGSVTSETRIPSAILGYDVQYRVYTPAGYDGEAQLPVIYTTDGHEYAHDEMGSMLIVLDNLIADGVMEPVIAVFVDPRNPDDLAENRRAEQFLMNPAYLAFFREELVPEIDAGYATMPQPEARAILGTSFGGVNAAYFGIAASDVFGLVGMQSPAFHSGRDLLDQYEQEGRLPLKIFMSTGTINDGEDMTRAMESVLVRKGYPLRYIEVPEGHSWGNWSALLDDMFTYFFPPSATGATPVEVGGGIRMNHAPNPVHDRATFTLGLPSAAEVTLEVFNMLGQRVATPLERVRYSAGAHQVIVAMNGLPAGVYVARMAADSRSTSSLIAVAP